jgi:hypothetical protein
MALGYGWPACKTRGCVLGTSGAATSPHGFPMAMLETLPCIRFCEDLPLKTLLGERVDPSREVYGYHA